MEMENEAFGVFSDVITNSMRKGRFAEALRILQAQTPLTVQSARSSLLADLLQRTGHNQEAHRVALQALKLAPTDDESSGRCYWTLGNVARELGDPSDALRHFQMAAKLCSTSSELSCWIQLRLMSTVADIAGSQTAMARLGDVRQCLTRFGDARPFTALHLWIAEVETRTGNLDSARRHLGIAQALLGQSDDVWLQGYFAINSFGVSYYSAQMAEARKWADKALEFVTISGHAAAQRAAHANLGHIEFSQGRLLKAREYFEQALRCTERQSPSYLPILDSIAQITLHLGELNDCKVIVDQLDGLSSSSNTTTSYYRAWALQTKLQLFLKQDRIDEAIALCHNLDRALPDIPQPRLRALLGLLSVEASLAQGDSEKAASKLQRVFADSSECPPDLLAETERVVAKTLRASGLPGIARINLARAARTYEVIGHAVGTAEVSADAVLFESCPHHTVEFLTARTSLDRVRALLETRRRPELFALEAVDLLKDLDCASEIGLTTRSARCGEPGQRPESDGPLESKAQESLSSLIYLTPLNQNGLCLEFSPKRDSGSIVAAITFQKIIERIIASQSERHAEADDILWPQGATAGTDEIVFAADKMIEILKTIRKVANTNLSVLITGETGTGKEVIAKTLHERSDRGKRPFIAFNCSAVPHDLFESQLFGYRRGAFSGANERFEGVIRAAHGGTLLLDEVGDIPSEMQPKLLRFLETGEIHPLGESQPIKVDVRLVLATNADLDNLVAQRRFREDLLFRINVIHIRVPPLRERREEIPLLVNLFARRFSRELAREQPKFSADVVEHLVLYDWPGNIRQLNNEVRRLIAMSEGADILPDCLSPNIRRAPGVATPVVTEALPSITISLNQHLSRAVEHLERTMLQNALKETDGQLTAAAKKLGLSRKGLYLKRQRLGMPLR